MDNISEILNAPPASLERISVILEYQANSMKELGNKVDKLTELSSAVNSLTDKLSSMEGQNRRVGDLATRQDIHQTLFYITGVVCLTFIPIMVGWNYQLRTELQTMHSTVDANVERIKSLERSVYQTSVKEKVN